MRDDDWIMLNNKHRIKSIKLKDQLMAIPVAWATQHNDRMFSLLNNVTEGLITGGIVQYLDKYNIENQFHNWIEEKVGPQKLSINDLRFGFQIWLVSCGIAIVIFLIEISVVNSKKIVKKIVEFYVLMIIVKQVLKKFY